MTGEQHELGAALREAADVFAAELGWPSEKLRCALLQFDPSMQEFDFLASIPSSPEDEALLRREYTKPARVGEIGLALMETRPIVLADIDRSLMTFDVGLDTLLGRRGAIYAQLTELAQDSELLTLTRLILSIHTMDDQLIRKAAETDGVFGLELKIQRVLSKNDIYRKLASCARAASLGDRHTLPWTAEHRISPVNDPRVERFFDVMRRGSEGRPGEFLPSMKSLGIAVAYLRMVEDRPSDGLELWKTIGMVIDTRALCDQIRAEREGASFHRLWATFEQEDYSRLLETCVFDSRDSIIEPACRGEVRPTTFPSYPSAPFVEALLPVRVSPSLGYVIAFGRRRTNGVETTLVPVGIDPPVALTSLIAKLHEIAEKRRANEPMAPHWADDLVRFLLQRLVQGERNGKTALDIVRKTCERLFEGSFDDRDFGRVEGEADRYGICDNFAEIKKIINPDYTAVWRVGEGLSLDVAYRRDVYGVLDHAIADLDAPSVIRTLLRSARVVARFRTLAHRLPDGKYQWDPQARWIDHERIYVALPTAFNCSLSIVVATTTLGRCVTLHACNSWSATLTFRHLPRLATILALIPDRDDNVGRALHDISQMNAAEPDLEQPVGLGKALTGYPSVAINHHAAFRTGGIFLVPFANQWNEASPTILAKTMETDGVAPKQLSFWQLHVLPDLAPNGSPDEIRKQAAILRLAQVHFRPEGFRERQKDIELIIPSSLLRVAGLKGWVSQAMILARKGADDRTFVVTLFRAKPPFGAPGLLNPYGASADTKALGIFDGSVRKHIERGVAHALGTKGLKITPALDWRTEWSPDLCDLVYNLLDIYLRLHGMLPGLAEGSTTEPPTVPSIDKLGQLYLYLAHTKAKRFRKGKLQPFAPEPSSPAGASSLKSSRRRIAKCLVEWSEFLLDHPLSAAKHELHDSLTRYLEDCKNKPPRPPKRSTHGAPSTRGNAGSRTHSKDRS